MMKFSPRGNGNRSTIRDSRFHMLSLCGRPPHQLLARVGSIGPGSLCRSASSVPTLHRSSLAVGKASPASVPPLRFLQSLKRNCSTQPLVPASRPPFPVRVALVGTSVGLATPLLAIGGVIFAWYRFLPLSAGGQAARTASELSGYKPRPRKQ